MLKSIYLGFRKVLKFDARNSARTIYETAYSGVFQFAVCIYHDERWR